MVGNVYVIKLILKTRGYIKSFIKYVTFDLDFIGGYGWAWHMRRFKPLLDGCYPTH